jgi:hypothetical protein
MAVIGLALRNLRPDPVSMSLGNTKFQVALKLIVEPR